VRRLLPLVTVVLLFAGCTGQPAAGPSTSARVDTPATASAAPPSSATSPSAAATPSAAVTTIEIQLKDGKVSPNGDRVDLTEGEQFVLDITSDRDDEVHVHGFDKEIEVSAGQHLQVPMTADRTGRFEVESHHPELLIVVLQIR
jgi:hypothetical protein